MKINQLPPSVYNRISAGEVVERPASVIKELVENSIDAGATKIDIEIENGGISKMVVADNGCGIDKDDMLLAFLPHSTSKVGKVDDLDEIETLGFRGEALASISSVCQIFLSSKTNNSQTGYCVNVDGGVFSQLSEIARNNGTTLECRNLFFNTPVRAKFLKKPKLEESEITSLVEKFLLAYPEIAFSYIVDGKQIFGCVKEELQDRIFAIYGKEIFDNLIAIDHVENDIEIKGFVVSPKVSRSNRSYQTLFVNSRYIENYLISLAVSNVYQSFLMKGRFPIFVLDIIVPSSNVDVNVHPTKKEVKFENQNQIFAFVKRAVEKALLKADTIPVCDIFDAGSFPNYESIQKNAFENVDQKVELPTLPQAEGFSYNIKDNHKVINEDINLNNDKPFPDFENIKIRETEISLKEPLRFDQQIENNYNFKQNKPLNSEMFNEYKTDEIKIQGVLFNTYVMAEIGEDVYIIDQHAAHERQLFDKINQRVDSSKVIKQNLLIPFAISLNHQEKQVFENSKEYLTQIGFEFECCDNQVEFLAVPLILENINLNNFVEDILKEDFVFDKTSKQIYHERLAQFACKHAIKGGDKLSKEQILFLVDKMKEGVFLCPHGRPIMVKLTKREIDKMFKRIL